jgi:tRNA1Val (adenine37-N6)-methyltransferase
MANDYFKLKRFTIRQSRCGMKVGTDGTLLGAWAHGGSTILDVGTGTGLIALMMAQRFPSASITGIDIDEAACLQARENVEDSPFSVSILHRNVLDMKGIFDAVVSNPPYFNHSLESPDAQRTMARHTSSLSYGQLMESAWRLLAEHGELSIVIPTECKSEIEREASLTGFFKVRECAVKTTPSKMPRRYLMAFRKHPDVPLEMEEGIIEVCPKQRSEWYQRLTNDFYL